MNNLSGHGHGTTVVAAALNSWTLPELGHFCSHCSFKSVKLRCIKDWRVFKIGLPSHGLSQERLRLHTYQISSRARRSFQQQYSSGHSWQRLLWGQLPQHDPIQHLPKLRYGDKRGCVKKLDKSICRDYIWIIIELRLMASLPMKGSLPPSSRITGVNVAEAPCITFLPTAGEPASGLC